MVFLCLLYQMAFTQAKSGVENYGMLDEYNGYVWMPVLHYQATSGLYAELRYNYEDLQTLSLFGGRTFYGGKKFQYTLTPIAGVSTGKFTGLSVGLNADADWKNFYVSSQSQFSMATKRGIANFFYSWSELGYSLSDRFYGGLAVQYTYQQGIADTGPGFVAGVNFNSVSIPLYVFRPFEAGRYFVLGLNCEFNFKKRKNNKG